MSTRFEQRSSASEPHDPPLAPGRTNRSTCPARADSGARVSAFDAGQQGGGGADCRFDSPARSRRPELRAGAGDGQHAGRHLRRAGAAASRRGAVVRERHHVQSRRVLPDAAERAAELRAVHARALVRPRRYPAGQLARAGRHAADRAGGRFLHVVRRANRRRRAASIFSFWASAAPGTSASTSRARARKAARG